MRYLRADWLYSESLTKSIKRRGYQLRATISRNRISNARRNQACF
jgi:hypothetical protein